MLSTGTMGDKLAALVVRVHESPVHRLASLRGLLALARKGAKRQRLATVDALRGLWCDKLLPDRKLIALAEVGSVISLGQSGWSRPAPAILRLCPAVTKTLSSVPVIARAVATLGSGNVEGRGGVGNDGPTPKGIRALWRASHWHPPLP